MLKSKVIYSNSSTTLESKLTAFFSENVDIEIVSITQSSTQDKTYVVIIYK